MPLVIFDIDGTLVDSQSEILAAMAVAFAQAGLAMPPRAQVLAIVGLSLPQAFARLMPDLGADGQSRMAEAYKAAFADRRLRMGAAAGGPLFPGALAALEAISAMPDMVLAVATGKSMRGLRAVLDGHGLQGVFQSLQTADDHPSKPHPSMILAALEDTGVRADRAVMVGDTTFDMEMARAAAVRSVGVTWGYHPGGHLVADRLIGGFDALPGAVADVLGGGA